MAAGRMTSNETVPVEAAPGTVTRRRLGGLVEEVPIGGAITGQPPISGTDFVNVQPAVPVSPRRKRKRRRKPLYKRPLVVIPIAALTIAMVLVAALGYQIGSLTNAVSAVSTPPPLVSGDRLGGDKSVVIDTGPAREAVRSYPDDRLVASSGGGFSDTISDMTTGAAVAAGVQDETPSGTMNILLMGVDARPGEAIDVGVRPDALAVLHLDAATGSCRMLAIPRDSRVDLPGYGLSKINHALAVGGIPYQEQVVEQFLDISIDHYGLIDFAGIEQLVDAVGGVTIEIPESFSIAGTTFEAGTQTLDGKRALLYARYRGGPDGDFGRIGRQQQVLRAILRKAGTSNPVTLIPRVLPSLEQHTRTSLDLTEIISIATQYRSTCTEETLETRTLSGTVATFPDPILQLDLSYVVIDDAEVRKQVAWLLGTGE